MTFTPEPFSVQHETATFDCGKPELDTWLKESAAHAEAMRSCRTFVWCRSGEREVVAYYSLAAHVVRRDDIGKIGRGSPDEIPAVLLARLALNRSLQGQHLGGVLLADALARVVLAGTSVGARFVVVDAIDDAVAKFSVKHGFKPVPDDPHHLVRKMSSVAGDVASG